MKPKRKISFFNKVMWLLTILTGLLLGAAILSQYINPAHIWIFSMFGFTFFTFYVMNLFFLVYWLLLKKKFLILPLIMLLAGLKIVTGVIQFNIPVSDKKLPEKNGIKIMSYNVRLFDLYNWTENLQTRARMFDLLVDESPDILCIQEFYNSDEGAFQNLDTLLKVQKAKYYHAEYTHTLRGVDHWGIATLSYYPIINKGKIELGEPSSNNIVIYSDIKINEDTIRVYNIHLQSIKFQREDYDLVEKFDKKNDTERLKGSKNIIKRLKRGFIKRSIQVDILKEHMDASPHPIILCGDFNDTPASYVYGVLSRNLKDAFQQSGFGFGRTYVGVFPSFRIDYILHDKKFHSSGYNTIRKAYSDHYPIYCTIYLNN